MTILTGPAKRLKVSQVTAKQELTTIQHDRFIFHRNRPTRRKHGSQAWSSILKNCLLTLATLLFCTGDSPLFAQVPPARESQQIITQANNNDGGVTGGVNVGSGGGGTLCLNRIAQPGFPRSWEAAINVAPFTTVNAVNRNLHIAIPIVSWSGLGPDMSMTLYYNSADADASPTRATQLRNSMGFDLGPGWRTSYSDTLISISSTKMTVVAEDGTQGTFTLVNGVWQAPPGIFDQLVTVQISGATVYRLLHKDQSFHEFDDAGKLIRIVDVGIFALTSFPTGKALTITRETGPFGPNGETTDRIKTMTGAAGRRVSFLYDTSNRLEKIKDENDGGIVGATGFQRDWTITYDASNRVSGILDPPCAGFVIPVTYEATSDRINSIADRRIASIIDPPQPYAFTYNSSYPDAVATVTDPLSMNQSFGTTCSSSGQLSTTYTDRRQAKWTYRATRDAVDPARQNGPIFEIVNPLNKTQKLGFNSSSYLLESYTDELGNTGTFTYDSRGNVLTATDPVGAAAGYSQVWTYDSTLNNLLTYTDGEGNTVTMLYEDTSYPTQVTKIIEPATQPGGSTDETLLSYYPPSATCVIGFSCNAGAGQIKRIVDPNGVVTEFEYDGFGQLSKYTEGENPSAPSFSYYRQFTTYDEATRPILTSADDGSVSSPASTSGSMGWDCMNRPTTNSCDGLLCEVGTCGPSAPIAACGSAFPFPDLPPGPLFPTVWADWNSSIYDEFNRLSSLPLNLNFKTNSSVVTKGRVHSFTYDDLGQVLTKTVLSNEYDSTAYIPRTFTYNPDLASGTFTRTGPDNMETVTQLDLAGRVQSYRRGMNGQTPLLESTATYYDNGLLKSFTNGNGTVTEYTYDNASRVTVIDHRTQASPGGQSNLKLVYSYDRRNLPTQILESSETGLVAPTTTTYTYDARGRLTAESRSTPDTNGIAYDLEYDYDAGGNRTEKRDFINDRKVVYTYDYTNATFYGSANNRLMFFETQKLDTTLISTTYYFYNGIGNPTNIVTEIRLPGVGEHKFSDTRFVYGSNGQTVTFMIGEAWNPPGPFSTNCYSAYQITFAREFRYDSGQQRYLDRELSPANLQSGTMVTLSETWTDYDGDSSYGDFTVTAGGPAMPAKQYEPGIGTIGNQSGTPVTNYLHNDQLGTLRTTTAGTSNTDQLRVFTAFGEKMSNDSQRFGYAGSWGYQSNTGSSLLHVGARYYDPSSGRFLQRDPSGIEGGPNVYAYGLGMPTAGVDPDGEFFWLLIAVVVIVLDVNAQYANAPAPGNSSLRGGPGGGGASAIAETIVGARLARAAVRSGLRWANRGRRRIGPSTPSGARRPRITVRMPNPRGGQDIHIDICSAPDWLLRLYK